MITTYQFMCKIVEYLNKVIYNQKILDANNTYIKKLVDDLKAYVDQYLEDLTVIKEQIENLNSTVSEHTTQIADIVTSITNLKQYTDDMIQSNFNELKSYVDAQDSILDEKINNIQIGAISVYNPTTGTLDPLQVVINDLYEMTNKDGLTATEFDALDLTATAFDNYEITAREFDSDGKNILV
jgi:chromosome segregation ATPase